MREVRAKYSDAGGRCEPIRPSVRTLVHVCTGPDGEERVGAFRLSGHVIDIFRGIFIDLIPEALAQSLSVDLFSFLRVSIFLHHTGKGEIHAR